jgi:hypothetical protein
MKRALHLESYSYLSGLQKINRLLLTGSAGCWLVFLCRLLFYSLPSDLTPHTALTDPKGPVPNVAVSRAVQISDLTRRNLFQSLIAPPPPKRVVQAPLAPPPPPKIPLSQRVSHLKLVGIMDTTPRQAIIENQRDQKTLYVSAGQNIDDVQVESITVDQVILASGDEHFNLTL